MRVLKRSRSGLELEVQLLDNQGRISNESARLMKELRRKNSKIDATFEAAQNVIELRSLPKVKLKDSLPRLFDDLEKTLDAAERLGMKIYGLGTYPGKFRGKIRDDERYKVQEKIFGTNFALSTSHCAGFHYHYALPRGVFDNRRKFLKQQFNSRMQKSLIDSYNFLVAADPAVSCLMQSSPFVDGKYVAKDSRILLYRSPVDLGYEKNMYKVLPEFSELPPYVFTVSDLRDGLISMDMKWRETVKASGYGKKLRKRILDFNWRVVKINKLGTVEYRGADMNHPKYFAGIAVLLKSVQRAIHQKYFEMRVSDAAIKTPFKVEGKTVLIPPLQYVKEKLQRASAYRGFDDKEIYNYTRRFFAFAKEFVIDDYRKLLKPLAQLISRKKTVSDVMVGRLRKLGYRINDSVPQEVWQEISLKHAEQFRREAFIVKDLLR